MAFDKKNVPTVYTQAGLTASNGSLEGLKGAHTSFNGYGIEEGETVAFGTLADYNEMGNIKKIPTFKGSTRFSFLVRCTRIKNGKSKDSWFNLGVLSRQMNEADGHSVPVDDFRKEMLELDDDLARLTSLVGKRIAGVGTVAAYRPVFTRSVNAQGVTTFTVEKDEAGNRKMEPANYVTIDYAN